MIAMPTTRHDDYPTGQSPRAGNPRREKRFGGGLREKARNTFAKHPHPHNRAEWGHAAIAVVTVVAVLVYAYGVMIWR